MSVYILKVFCSFFIFVSYNASASDKWTCGMDGSCCPNYYMYDGKCIECPKGTYGSNCSQYCPKNMYGESCIQNCNCSEDQFCDPVHGCSGTYGLNCTKKCPKNMYVGLCVQKCSCSVDQYCDPVHGCSDPTGECSTSNRSDVECCLNYMPKNGRCIECVRGKWGKNCSDNCPTGYYGHLCAEKCSCQKNCDSVTGCAKEEPRDQIEKVMIWTYILPGIISSVCICIFVFYIRWKRKKSSPRNFVDIPHIYSHTSDFFGNSGNDVSDNLNITDRNTMNANGNRKTTEDIDSLVKGSCDEEHETGAYSKLTLRLNYCEEPVRHTPLAKSYSDTPSLPIGPLEHSEKKIQSQQKIKRISSLRNVKSTTELDSWYLGDIPTEKYAKDASKTTANHTLSLEDCSNVFDLASNEDKNYKGVPFQQNFLKELTTQLMNVKKY